VTVEEENSYVPIMYDLIIETLQDIEVSFDCIPKIPRGTPLREFLLGTPDLFLEQDKISGAQRDDQLLLPPPEIGANDIKWLSTPLWVVINNMVGHIPIENVPPLSGNSPSPLQPSRWRTRNIIAMLGPMHHLPRHSEKYITKFDLESKYFAEEHIL